MADYKAIMMLALAGHSYSEIVAAVGCSRREIAAVKKTITAYGITAGQAASMNPAEIAGMFPMGANASRRTTPNRILIGCWRR